MLQIIFQLGPTTQYALYIPNGVNYVTLDGLDLRYGYVTAYILRSNNLEIKHCNIGWGTDRFGMLLQWSDNGILSNNIFDNGARYRYTYPDQIYDGNGQIIGGYGMGASDGFKLPGGSNWVITDNVFKNWYHAGNVC